MWKAPRFNPLGAEYLGRRIQMKNHTSEPQTRAGAKPQHCPPCWPELPVPSTINSRWVGYAQRTQKQRERKVRALEARPLISTFWQVFLAYVWILFFFFFPNRQSYQVFPVSATRLQGPDSSKAMGSPWLPAAQQRCPAATRCLSRLKKQKCTLKPLS